MAGHPHAAHGLLALFLLPAAVAMTILRHPTQGQRERAIPTVTLQQVLDPAAYAEAVADWATTVVSDPTVVLHTPEDKAFGGTPGQDRGKCPIVKLPSLMVLKPTESHSTGLSGVWMMPSSSVALASFGQNFLSNSWDRINVRNLDERLALRAEIKSDEQLQYLYDWKAQAAPQDYPAISTLMKAFRSENSTRPPITISLSDCEDRLMFVLRLHRDGDALTDPGDIGLYDRLGNLVAYALADPLIARYQFVDPMGHRLAVAESPGLYQNVSMKDMPRDGDRGRILPFELQVDAGGYANASRLMDPEWRWILAAAVQLRAIEDAHSEWPLAMPRPLVAIYWVFSVVGLLVLLGVCFAMYRVVYPSSSGVPQHLGAETKMATHLQYTPAKVA